MPRIRTGPLAREALLADAGVRRWYNNLQRGSLSTADVYLRRLAVLCEKMGKTPQDLARLPKESVDDFVMDFVTEEEKASAAGSYVKHSVVVLRSWLAHNGLQITKRVKIRGANRTPRIENERVPTQDELHRLFMHCTPQSRVAAVLVAHAGLRPEVIGNYRGDDGLRLKDLPDLVVDLQAKSVSFRQTPARVVVRPELSKAGHTYFTFLTEEGCEYVGRYLRERLQDGEALAADSDLVTPTKKVLRGKARGKRFIRANNIGDIIRTAIRSAELSFRPYALRAYFDTQLLVAESKGKLAHDYRVFWMGHKGSMEARYTTNKGRLTSEMHQDMREAYERCSPFLSTLPSKSEEDLHREIATVMLTTLGYTREELQEQRVDVLDEATFKDLLDRKVAAHTPAVKRVQVLVGAKELPGYLAKGWTVVTAVGQDQVVLSPPA